MKFFLILILFFGLGHYAFAEVTLNVDITHQKGLDKDLVLVSEYHIADKLGKFKKININLKNGIRIQCFGELIEDFSSYGPSGKVSLTIEIFQRKIGGQRIFLKKMTREIKLEETKEEIIFDKEGQLISAKITPYIQ